MQRATVQPRILIVEDSRTFASLLTRSIREQLGLSVDVAGTLAEARRLVADCGPYLMGLADLNLPDAPTGESVDLMVAAAIPTIVFSTKISKEWRARFWAKGIVDYVIKENIGNLDYLMGLISRVLRNQNVGVLLVDDSPTVRTQVAGILRVHRYAVYEAADPQSALQCLDTHPNIHLALLDYVMPEMNGAELATLMRKTHPRDRLSIIGFSGRDDAETTAQFLKSGANDFIHKPFRLEEFYCRVSQNIEMIEHFKTIREMASKDYLTRLHNRQYLFEMGTKLLASQQRNMLTVTAALLDIDHFKIINDTYGHQVGDEALRHLANILSSRFRETDVVARYGGEEFCILAVNMAPEFIMPVFEELREVIAANPVRVGDIQVSLTVSIGICSRPTADLESLLREADKALYEAKHMGRNQVRSCVLQTAELPWAGQPGGHKEAQL